MKDIIEIPKIELSDEERNRILSETIRHTASEILNDPSVIEHSTDSDA